MTARRTASQTPATMPTAVKMPCQVISRPKTLKHVGVDADGDLEKLSHL